MTRAVQYALLPRRLLFDPPERRLVRISPDGQWIAFQTPIDGVLNLWIAPADESERARPFTKYVDRGIGPALLWAHDNRHGRIFRDKAGDENWRIMSIDIGNGEAVPLSPGGGAKACVQQTSRHFSGEVLIAHNERDKGLFDIYHVKVANGASTLVEKNDGFLGFFTDEHFQVRFASDTPTMAKSRYSSAMGRVHGKLSLISRLKTRSRRDP